MRNIAQDLIAQCCALNIYLIFNKKFSKSVNIWA